MLDNALHLYWHHKRKPCGEVGKFHFSGTESYLSFSKLTNSSSLNNIIVTPELTCTNRDETLNIPFGGNNPIIQMYPNNIEQMAKIVCITNISKPKYRNLDTTEQMDLLTHININQLGFGENTQTKCNLQNILSIYNFDEKSDRLIIEKGIAAINIKSATRRSANQLKLGLCQGTEYTITIDEQYFSEKNSMLFARVILQFLRGLCNINSFVQLNLHSKQRGFIKQWKPEIGTKKLL